jgi:hypothetical protein
MNPDTACEQVRPIPMGLGDFTIGGAKEKMTRTRLVELTVIAKDIATAMDNKGVKSNERCIFGQIIQQMLQY